MKSLHKKGLLGTLLCTFLLTVLFTISAFAETVYLNSNGETVDASSQLIATTITLKDGAITNVSPTPIKNGNYGDYTARINQYLENKENGTGNATSGAVAGSGSGSTTGATESGASEEDEKAAAPDIVLYQMLLGEVSAIYGSSTISMGAASGSEEINATNVVNPVFLLGITYEKVTDIISTYTRGSIYAVFTAVACAFMIIFFLSDMTSKDIPQNFGPNGGDLLFFIKPFSKLIIGMLLLIVAPKIINSILTISQFVYKVAVKTVGAVTAGGSIITPEDLTYGMMKASGVVFIKPSIVDTITNFGTMLGLVLPLALPYLIATVSNLLLIWTVLSRMFNLILQAIIAPLAFTDFYSERPFTDTRAFGFCRDFLGLCFQSTVIILAFAVTQSLISTLTGDLVAGLSQGGVIAGFGKISEIALFLSAIKITQATVVMGSAQLSKKAFGA